MVGLVLFVDRQAWKLSTYLPKYSDVDMSFIDVDNNNGSLYNIGKHIAERGSTTVLLL